MREKRIYLECDRCKKNTTLKKKHEVQGVEIYEEAEGWLREAGKDFYPDCAKEYKALMEKFYK